jgi:thioredoxin reductase (NADPH)
MSAYLVERLSAAPNIDILEGAEIAGVSGTRGRLASVTWRTPGGGARVPAQHLFLFIGADPNTDWLAGSGVAVDEHGFVRTGDANAPGSLTTSLPGIFAVGDVRSGSVKRVAAAAGDGARAVAGLHAFLAEPGLRST